MAAGSIRNPFLGFQTSNQFCQNPKSDYQNYDSFRLSKFWLLFLNQSRVNLVSRKRNSLKLKHNKAFKRDSCRVAFLVCSQFWW